MISQHFKTLALLAFENHLTNLFHKYHHRNTLSLPPHAKSLHFFPLTTWARCSASCSSNIRTWPSMRWIDVLRAYQCTPSATNPISHSASGMCAHIDVFRQQLVRKLVLLKHVEICRAACKCRAQQESKEPASHQRALTIELYSLHPHPRHPS